MTGHRKNAIIFGGIILALLALAGGGTVYVTSKPGFCRVCHIMEPYYEDWASSSHSDVECIECHSSPSITGSIRGRFEALFQMAKYITGTSGERPWAEIEDASCLRSGCHTEEEISGSIDFRLGIRFSHDLHRFGDTMPVGLKCTSCHSEVAMGSHIEVTPQTCFVCHFGGRMPTEPLGGCVGCHGIPADPLRLENGAIYSHELVVSGGIRCTRCHGDVTRGDIVVSGERCRVCHTTPTPNSMADSERIHRVHVIEHKVECNDCHNEIVHGYERRDAQPDPSCGGCHGRSHGRIMALYSGTGAEGVEERPDPMYLAQVDCLGCHLVSDSEAADGGVEFHRATPAVCADCHDSSYIRLTEAWLSVLEERLSGAERRVERVRRLVGRRTDLPGDLLGEAERNLEFLSAVNPIHNPGYAMIVLEKIEADAASAAALIEGRPYSPAEPREENRCTEECHIAVRTGNPRFEGLRFPHGLHADELGIDCSGCHIGATPEDGEGHGTTRITTSDCAVCHHMQGRGCSACHGRGGPESSDVPHRLHASAGVRCYSCHSSGTGGVSRRTCDRCHHSGRRECSECHGEGRDTPFRGVVFPHPLHAALGCEACHTVRGGRVVTAPGCANCHHETQTPSCEGCHPDGY